MSEHESRTRRPPAPTAVRLSILLAFGLFLLTVAVLYYRYMTTPETNCNIVINGNQQLAGSVVTVSSITAPARTTLTATIGDKNRYQARFFLPSGTYHVKMVKPDGMIIIDEDTFVPPGRFCTYDVARLFPEEGRSTTTPVKP